MAEETPLNKQQRFLSTIGVVTMTFLIIPILFFIILVILALKETLTHTSPDWTQAAQIKELWITAGLFGMWSLPQVRGSYQLIMAATENVVDKASVGRAKGGLFSWMFMQGLYIFWELLFACGVAYKFFHTYPGVHYERISFFANLPLVFVFLVICMLTRGILMCVGNNYRVELKRVEDLDEVPINKERIVNTLYMNDV